LVVSVSPQRSATPSASPLSKSVLLKRDISIGNIVTADGTTTFKLASHTNVAPGATASAKLPNIIRSPSHPNGDCFE
jgi:hypothetical protein